MLTKARVEGASAVEVRDAAVALYVNSLARLPAALRPLAHVTLQRHLDHVERIEYCADARPDHRARYELLSRPTGYGFLWDGKGI